MTNFRSAERDIDGVREARFWLRIIGAEHEEMIAKEVRDHFYHLSALLKYELDGKHLLTARQLATITHLVASPSVEEACRRAKVSKPTVYSWLKDEAFKAELQGRREEVYKDSLERLKAGGQRAVQRLLKLIDSKREEIALRACTQIIAANLKLKEINERPSHSGKDVEVEPPFTLENLRAAWAARQKIQDAKLIAGNYHFE